MRKIVLSILITIFLIFTFSMIIAFSKNYYLYEFGRIRPEKDLNVDAKFIRYSAQIIADFLSNKRNDLLVPGFKDFFNEKEILHMIDVKNIFNSLLFITIVIGVVIFLFIKSKEFSKIFLYSLIFTLIFVFLLLIFPFDFLFTKFHLLLFNNNLWLLDPAKDRLINLLPTEFFIRASYRIIIYTVILLTFLFLIFKVLEVDFEKRDK